MAKTDEQAHDRQPVQEEPGDWFGFIHKGEADGPEQVVRHVPCKQSVNPIGGDPRGQKPGKPF